MGIVKTKGIIITESNAGDSDKMLTILTPGIRKNWMLSQGSFKNKKSSYGTVSKFYVLENIFFLKGQICIT